MWRVAAAISFISLMDGPIWGLTFQECLAEAANNNPSLAAAEAATAKARAQKQASLAPFLPRVSGDAGYTRSGSDTNVSGDYSTGLSASQSVFSGLKDKAGYDRSSAELMASEASLQSVRANVSAELKSSFARLLFAQEQVSLTAAIAKRREENVRLVELRYEAGREHKGSFLRSKASHTSAKFEVSQARRAVRVAQRGLAKTLGRAESSVLEATGTLKTLGREAPPDIEALSARTPAVLQSQAQSRAASAGLTIAKGELFPGISANAATSRRGMDWESHRWSAGVSLSIPLFAGGRNVLDVKGARAEETRVAANARAARHEARLSLEEAYASTEDATERTEVQREFLEAAQVRSEIARGQYTSGLLSFEDWDLIENDLIAAQKAHLASLRDAVLAEAQWEKTQGKGLIK